MNATARQLALAVGLVVGVIALAVGGYAMHAAGNCVRRAWRVLGRR